MDIRLIILYVIGDFIFTKILFGYNHALSIAMFYAIIITPLDMVDTRFNYNFGGERVEQNPLYERGCFRDNPRFLPWLKGLKGGCYLQMGLYVLIGIAIIYRIIRVILFDGDFQYEFSMAEWLLMCCFIGLICLRFVIDGYYRIKYARSCQYIKNKNGIWEPFSCILRPVKHTGWKQYYVEDQKEFCCHYYVRYIKIREKLDRNCQREGYIFLESYRLQDDGECRIYHKKRNETLKIFLLIHIKEYSKEKMKELNAVFEDYWLKFIGKKKKVKDASIIFLMCIDEHNRLLEKRLFNCQAIDQSRRRHRLPGILVFSENATLTIPERFGTVFGVKEYKKMRAELLKLLDISERYNHVDRFRCISYGNREEYEEEKTEKLLNSK